MSTGQTESIGDPSTASGNHLRQALEDRRALQALVGNSKNARQEEQTSALQCIAPARQIAQRPHLALAAKYLSLGTKKYFLPSTTEPFLSADRRLRIWRERPDARTHRSQKSSMTD